MNDSLLPPKAIIGALHFTPLPGYQGFIDMESVIQKAKKDMKALLDGGVDAVIIENNYDLPHKMKVGKETVDAMTELGKGLSSLTEIPIGVSVLWNDYEAAFTIAKAIGGKFIRVPAFVDTVSTDFGIANAEPDLVIEARNKLGTEEIRIFADIQVKHAKMLIPRPIEESAMIAAEKGADFIIVTGQVTGQPPEIQKIITARQASGIPVFVGSGLDSKNAQSLLKYADGAIVSTSLKDGNQSASERNAKPYSSEIDVGKVRELMEVVETIRKI
ncbi:MAG: BtpA/SgcQ family protein [Candidatus Micrarchaeales archaeon]